MSSPLFANASRTPKDNKKKVTERCSWNASELICSGTLPAPVLRSDHSFRSKITRREPEMDLTSAFAFLDSDSEDEAPSFVVIIITT